jgi:hypothetical protein
MALNAAKVRASVVGTISAPGHFCLFFPDDVMTADRLSGRYCALQTVDQSERAANDLRQSVEMPPCGTNLRPTALLATNLQPCIGLQEIDIAAAL